MDIKIPHSWLKDHLETKATPLKIGECLALCGPSFEKLTKDGNDQVYEIEVTTNRVDSASVRGIAQEAAAILPQFGISAKLKPFNPTLPKISVTNPSKLNIKIDTKLNNRVMAVVIDNVSADAKSPLWMRERLERSGVRSLNLLVDITNYVMLEVGHPTHVFDYEKIKNISFRLSKKGERVTTFDNKTYTLPGNDIVIADSSGEIIDLPGIMGTKNSVVSKDTKKIIFFIDNNDPVLMRKTSLTLGIRTMAVQLNEKGVDPELASAALARGIELYVSLAKGKIVSQIYDFYPKKVKTKTMTVSLSFINSLVGIEISATRVQQILKSLGFGIKSKNKDELIITIPTSRISDIAIPEDIVEEVSRIYGYHNIPSILMKGAIPTDINTKIFNFENLVKSYLQGFGAVEVYTISLVSKEEAGDAPLKLKNPLGDDTKYLRTTLFYTTIRSLKENKNEDQPIHIFEMANVYLARRGELPREQMMLSGGFANTNYRQAKGVIEALLESLHIQVKFTQVDQGAEILVEKEVIGKIGPVGANLFYYEFDMSLLQKHYKAYLPYQEPARYPAQIEDMTFVFSQNITVGDVIEEIKNTDKLVRKVELNDVYKDSYTFRIWYQAKNKTLTDKEVKDIRLKVIKLVANKFSGTIK